MIDNNIVIFQFSLTSPNLTNAEIWKIEALSLDIKTMGPYPESRFTVQIRPDRPEDVQPGSGVAVADMLTGINAAEAWSQFASWCLRWNLKGRSETRFAPIPCSYRLHQREWPLYLRYAHRFKTIRDRKQEGPEPTLFNNEISLDISQLLIQWTADLPEPTKHSLDYIRKFTEVPQHLSDLEATAMLATKLTLMMRSINEKPGIIWPSMFNEEKVKAARLRIQGFRSQALKDREEREAKQAKFKNRKNWSSDE